MEKNEDSIRRLLFFEWMNTAEDFSPEDWEIRRRDLLELCDSIAGCCPTLLSISRSADRKYDKGLPPGSKSVKRALSDSRYVLCLACIALSKLSIIRQDNVRGIVYLKRALVWFPYSVSACYSLAMLLKTALHDPETLAHIEILLKKAIQYSVVLKTATPVSGPNSSYTDLIELQQLIRPELHSGQAAVSAYSLLLCQSGRAQQAVPFLESLGFTWRLSTDVLCYELDAIKPASPTDTTYQNFMRVYDGVFDESILSHLNHVFRPEAPYWREHDYDALVCNSSRKVGYFSYVYPLRSRAAFSSVEHIIDRIFDIVCAEFPIAKDAIIAEWWVHSRFHSSGHQLHFDSDETGIEDGGKPEHPLVSAVLFVTAGPTLGGPTLVTDQVLGGPLASKGWLCFGQNNRLAMFDARYLHGVIPGRGVPSDGSQRRLTFMVGFWKQMRARDRGPGKAGPGQPFPAPESHYTWPVEMNSVDSVAEGNTNVRTGTAGLVRAAPIPVSKVWEPLHDDVVAVGVTANAPPYQNCFQGF